MAKVRHQLLLDEDVRARAQQMAANDERTFPGMLKWLINQEWQRRHPNQGELVLPPNGNGKEKEAA